MFIDARTLIFASSIALVITVFIVVISSKINRNMHGVKSWAMGYISLSIGLLLQTTQGTLSPILNVLPANLLIPAGFYLVLIGLMQYKKRKTPNPYTIIPIILLTLSFHLMVGLGPESLIDRTIFTSTLCGLLALIGSFILLTERDGPVLATEKLTGIAIAFLSIGLFARAATSFYLTDTLYLTEDNPHNHATHILALVFTIFLSFGLTIMPAEKVQQQLQYLVNTDFLTGTLSRRAFIDQANRLVNREQTNNTPMSLIVFDIDDFKKVNDQYGHSAGDLVLTTLCQNIKEMIRPNDLFSRFGGEEFVLLLVDTDAEQALQVGERLRSQVENTTIQYEGEAIKVTISVGVIGINQEGLSFKDFYYQADQQLYRAKYNGKNQVQFQNEVTFL
jgi:diguanylate cyclase (GGDEF)-like protein